MNGDDERDYDEEAAVQRDIEVEGEAELAAERAVLVDGHGSGPAHYRESERLLGKQARVKIPSAETFQGPPTTDEILRGIGHALLAVAAAHAMNIRRNGAVEAIDEAAGWERVLG